MSPAGLVWKGVCAVVSPVPPGRQGVVPVRWGEVQPVELRRDDEMTSEAQVLCLTHVVPTVSLP